MIMENILPKAINAVKTLATRTLTIECDNIPHEFRNIPVKKMLNWLFLETSVLLRTSRPWGMPTHLHIEPTNACNLGCALCPVTEGLQRDTGRIHMDTFKQIIDEIGEYLFLIMLDCWGEPFLHPRIFDMIVYARRHGIQVRSCTNGSLFTKNNRAEKLVRSGLNSLTVAVDGITQGTYEAYRKGGDIETVIAGIREIVVAKKRLNSKTPLVNFRFIAMKQNEHEIPRLRDFAENLGVDILTIRTLIPYDGHPSCETREDGKAFIPDNPAYRRFSHDPETKTPVRRASNPCKALWNNPFVFWDSNVSPCCFDPHGMYVLGDMKKESFSDIWFGTGFRDLRRRFRSDYKKLSLCADCTYAFEGGACNTEDIVETVDFSRAGRSYTGIL